MQYKILGVMVFMLSSISTVAQVKGAFAQVNGQTVEVDALTKIIGILLTIAGFFMGYMQLKMAQKIAEVEARFNRTIVEVEKQLETKISLSGKEIEAKMATRHDIDNIKTVSKLQHENLQLQLKGLDDKISRNNKEDNK